MESYSSSHCVLRGGWQQKEHLDFMLLWVSMTVMSSLALSTLPTH